MQLQRGDDVTLDAGGAQVSRRVPRGIVKVGRFNCGVADTSTNVGLHVRDCLVAFACNVLIIRS